MDKETATIVLQLLQRTDIKGAEVPAFVKVLQTLNNIIQEPVETKEKAKKK